MKSGRLLLIAVLLIMIFPNGIFAETPESADEASWKTIYTTNKFLTGGGSAETSTLTSKKYSGANGEKYKIIWHAKWHDKLGAGSLRMGETVIFWKNVVSSFGNNVGTKFDYSVGDSINEWNQRYVTIEIDVDFGLETPTAATTFYVYKDGVKESIGSTSVELDNKTEMDILTWKVNDLNYGEYNKPFGFTFELQKLGGEEEVKNENSIVVGNDGYRYVNMTVVNDTDTEQDYALFYLYYKEDRLVGMELVKGTIPPKTTKTWDEDVNTGTNPDNPNCCPVNLYDDEGNVLYDTVKAYLWDTSDTFITLNEATDALDVK